MLRSKVGAEMKVKVGAEEVWVEVGNELEIGVEVKNEVEIGVKLKNKVKIKLKLECSGVEVGAKMKVQV